MNFAVIGAGAWGTAFAIHLSRLGHPATLVPRRFEQALALASGHENTEHLPGVEIPSSVQIGHELTPVLMEAEVVLLACPAQALRETCGRIQKNRAHATQLRFVISLAKGVETGTHLRPSEIINATIPGVRAGILSGPTNAGEVALGKLAAMVLATARACSDTAEIQAAISGPNLRVYTSDDIVGVELGGALKNVYAIAAGVCDGLRRGDNVKAALLTRALAEMIRVGQALGARPETFYGLSGFGDLIATSYGSWSRNRTFGQHLAEGRTAGEIISTSHSVIEGYRTAQSLAGLCAERGIDTPVLNEIHAVLFKQKPLDQTITDLMGRNLKAE
ncbi:NAD(P)H-dependent glycerol-3-phosphate dehydrogenase [Ereboglobus luteus]|uniref:Glycerol-3-phosphate dehydrogenase [NAD(P)+] n=1 Tax=Ereboglobus luteus TaxID=1796921 RepID=A0A2U8E0Z3_9BACT|nr:NAD(P)H-dependent glycerol-3-phosphate dehydrogenase [Ereboglobus luteus]AWI08491.1 glycerol-3-phosphate dehydrogenase [Ereboglobus luteus]